MLYAGTIGLVSGAEIVVEVARRLENYQDILFLFVGTGHAQEAMEAKVHELRFEKYSLFTISAPKRLSEVQATADVSLVTVAPGRGKPRCPAKF